MNFKRLNKSKRAAIFNKSKVVHPLQRRKQFAENLEKFTEKLFEKGPLYHFIPLYLSFV